MRYFFLGLSLNNISRFYLPPAISNFIDLQIRYFSTDLEKFRTPSFLSRKQSHMLGSLYFQMMQFVITYNINLFFFVLPNYYLKSSFPLFCLIITTCIFPLFVKNLLFLTYAIYRSEHVRYIHPPRVTKIYIFDTIDSMLNFSLGSFFFQK